MTDLDRAEQAYMYDDRYRAVVQMLVSEIEALQLTPSGVRQMAVFACVMVERRRTVPSYSSLDEATLNDLRVKP